MIRIRKNLLLGGLLLISVAGSWWLVRETDRQPAYQPEPHRPDYYLERFSATTLGDDGRPDKQLSADRMLHFPDDDTTELTRPRFTVYDGDLPPWRARAETGWVSGNKELVLLQGRVYIDRSEATGVRPIHIVTRDLKVQPSNNYAETDEDTFAQSSRDWIESRGMQIWFAAPIRVKLLANVRGRHEIN